MNEDKNEAFWLVNQEIGGLDIEETVIDTEEDVLRLKRGLRLRFPLFMANIIKILLFRKEEPLACLLTAYFELALDREMFRAALGSKNYTWL